MLPKDQELAQLVIKPETITKFKVGVKKDGRITAIHHEVYVSVGDLEFGVHADGPGNAFNQLELYTSQVPHWRSLWCAYRTNAPRPGPSRSHIQQETKWSWENMMDEMAEAAGMDPVEFRLMHITRIKPEDTRHPYQSFASVEVLNEGAKAFGWDKRNPVAGSAPGRFKRGLGIGMSQHHGGLMGYHEGEEAFARLAAAPGANLFQHRVGSWRRRLRDHEGRAPRQRIERRHRAGSSHGGDVGLHHARSHPHDLGRLRHRAVER